MPISCRKITLIIFSLGAVLLSPGCAGKKSLSSSLVKLSVTCQKYNPASPWKKYDEKTRSGYGCILPSRRILTTADIVQDSTLIRIKKSSSPEFFTARVEVVDKDADLATLSVEDKSFFTDLTPVELGPPVHLDQPVKFLVFEESNQLREIPGTIVKISVEDYYLGWEQYLVYGAAVNFEDRGGGWSEPVFAGGKLIGLDMSYSAANQYAQIIPSLIIRHFLDGIRPSGYRGFPSPGLGWSKIVNPDLRKYLDLPAGLEGVYIRDILPDSFAAAILKVGDVLLSVDGLDLDAEGYYRNPVWGKLSFLDIISRLHYPGDPLELRVFRRGRVIKLSAPLKVMTRKDYLVPVVGSGVQPRYIVFGGVVIQELTLDYLKAWGKDWKDKADKKYLYYYDYEAQKPTAARRRLVILNKILPDDVNIGYQNLRDNIISTVNGRPISRLEDVAEALRHPPGKYHSFTLEEYRRQVVLPVKGIRAADLRIAKRYGIGKLANIQ